MVGSGDCEVNMCVEVWLILFDGSVSPQGAQDRGKFSGNVGMHAVAQALVGDETGCAARDCLGSAGRLRRGQCSRQLGKRHADMVQPPNDGLQICFRARPLQVAMAPWSLRSTTPSTALWVHQSLRVICAPQRRAPVRGTQIGQPASGKTQHATAGPKRGTVPHRQSGLAANTAVLYSTRTYL